MPQSADEPRGAAKLRDKIAIVTGAGRGIGRVIALRFAAEGARVVIADLAADNATKVASEINAHGGAAIAVTVDVADAASAKAMVSAAVQRFGRLDVLVNNAGVGLNRPFLRITPEEWERVIRINLTGTFFCAQAAAAVMAEQGGGRIVNIASISGQRGAMGRTAYGASKAGVILLTKSMAVELSRKGVIVNAIAPGPVVTDMTAVTHSAAVRRSYHERIPMARYVEAEEVAAAAVYLGSDDAKFVAGHILNVDGGFNAAGLMFEPEG